MELKRCARCGSFFTSDSEVCQICNRKDNADVLKLKNFLDEQETNIENKEQLAMYTGISIKNIDRYLNMKEFSNINFENKNKNYTELV
ncbi:MAG: hypothetical protein ACI4UE_06715 [Candidatus Scatovivens sp.]